MNLTYEELMHLQFPERRVRYCERDTILYALGVGAGSRLEGSTLDFVVEDGLKALPGLATVIGWDDTWLQAIGLDLQRVVHGEQRITLHRPLRPHGEIVVHFRITEGIDKGVEKGALLYAETTLCDAHSGTRVATLLSTVFARGDGGFGGPAGSPMQPHAIPARAPNFAAEAQIAPNQSLLFRLCGDRNPLHVRDEFARVAGFPRPILHGLCTYGFAIRAVVESVCDCEPHRIERVAARFSGPVFPGEVIRTDMWCDGGTISFRTVVPERSTIVLDHGRIDLRDTSIQCDPA